MHVPIHKCIHTYIHTYVHTYIYSILDIKYWCTTMHHALFCFISTLQCNLRSQYCLLVS